MCLSLDDMINEKLGQKSVGIEKEWKVVMDN